MNLAIAPLGFIKVLSNEPELSRFLAVPPLGLLRFDRLLNLVRGFRPIGYAQWLKLGGRGWGDRLWASRERRLSRLAGNNLSSPQVLA